MVLCCAAVLALAVYGAFDLLCLLVTGGDVHASAAPAAAAAAVSSAYADGLLGALGTSFLVSLGVLPPPPPSS